MRERRFLSNRNAFCQSMACQSVVPVSRFASGLGCIELSSLFKICSSVFGVIHQTHVSPLSKWVLPYPAGYEFPLPFGLPTFASWVFLFPLKSCAFPCGQAYCTCGTDFIGVTTFHTSEIRPGGVPPLWRGLGCSPFVGIAECSCLSRHYRINPCFGNQH